MVDVSAVWSRKVKNASWKAFCYVLLSLISIIMIMPFLWMVSTSLKDLGSVFTFPPRWIPEEPIWSHYVDVWEQVPMLRWYANSTFVTLAITFGQLLTSSLAAYGFARMQFPGRDQIFLIYLATLMLPFHVRVIPLFSILSKLGWLNTYKALIIPQLANPFGTFLLRQFFLTIPRDLEDAAIIDGCSRFRIYSRIIIPLSKPALATLATFVFMGIWNQFFWPLIVTSTPQMRTLAVGLALFKGRFSTDWPLLMTASVIVLIPSLVVFIFNQRFFTKGILLGGVKG